ncbi:MAG TPA: NADH-quinone oxidoreductase subunit NuoE [Spirochaetota bacterium]|nr:NADH-quinone oxidoreductase subunit NuoE [Spirochaetota bacterium]
MSEDVKKIDSIIARYEKNEESLLAVLQDLQREFNYVPEEGIVRLSKAMDVPLSKIYAMGTFYKALSLTPRGKHVIKVCMGTACHLKGAGLMVEAIERDLEIKCGETTKDMKFTLETVNCVGACAMAPVVVVGDDYHGHISPSKVTDTIKKYGQ